MSDKRQQEREKALAAQHRAEHSKLTAAEWEVEWLAFQARLKRGCWTPGEKNCNCPACGGPND